MAVNAEMVATIGPSPPSLLLDRPIKMPAANRTNAPAMPLAMAVTGLPVFKFCSGMAVVVVAVVVAAVVAVVEVMVVVVLMV